MFRNHYKLTLCGLSAIIVCVLSLGYYAVSVIEPRPRFSAYNTHALSAGPGMITRNSTFVYSEDELFETILDIRKRNCHQENYENDDECRELRQCNSADLQRPPPLPTCKRRLPRCIIIGVSKAGTREVIDFLMMHPQIIVKKKPLYEISFFSNHWERGVDWYRDEMPYSMPEQITIEKSPLYFMHFETPSRIRDTIPEAKLILIVRDPVERAISQATWVRRKATSLLERFLNDPSDETNKVLRSVYDEPFQRYLQYFNRSQIHVIDSERFKLDPYGVLRDIETYLGVPNVVKNTDFEFNEESGFFCLRSVKQPYSVCFGKNRGRKDKGDKFEAYKPRLRRIFKPHNDRFFELVGQKFNWP